MIGAAATAVSVPGALEENAMSQTDTVFALIAFAVVVAFTVGLWLTNLL